MLMICFLNSAKQGVNTKLIAFQQQTHIYWSDSCPFGLTGYSDKGLAWSFEIPEDLLFRSPNNLLEYVSSIISSWVDMLAGRLNTGHRGLCPLDDRQLHVSGLAPQDKKRTSSLKNESSGTITSRIFYFKQAERGFAKEASVYFPYLDSVLFHTVHYATLPFHHSAIPPFRHSTIPPFHHSTIPPFNHSAIPSFRHSAIPPFRHSAIPPFRHSAILLQYAIT